MSMESLIGIDIGGTKIRAGLVEGEHVTNAIQVENPARASVDDILAVLMNTIAQVKNSAISAIGICIPGLVDAENGVVYEIKNIPALSGFPLAETLRQKFGVPVYLNNDANCYAVGEKYFGLGRDYSNIVAFTLGTGLGAGLIIDGKVHNGKVGGAGEFGSLNYLDKTLEYYCSSEFFRRVHGTDSLSLSGLAHQGDDQALRIFHAYGEHIGQAISFALSILDPELVILGGAITHSYDLFERGMKAVLEQYPLKRISTNTRIAVGSLTDSAVLGAAALYFDHDNR